MKRNDPVRLGFGEDDPKTGGELANWAAEVCGFRSGSIKVFSGWSPSHISADWTESVPALVQQIASSEAEARRQEIRFKFLELTVQGLLGRVEQFETNRPLVVPINSFNPEPYDVLKPFLISVQWSLGGYSAAWVEANIYVTAENEFDAVNELKNVVLDVFDSLSDEPEEKLALTAKQQLALLREFIKKRN